MKVLRKILVFMLITSSLLLTGCNKRNPYENMTKITYELEGGTYQNSSNSIIHYYDFKESSENLIIDPVDLTKEQLSRNNYDFKGWYQTKKTVGDNLVYEDKWEFDKSYVTTKELTLYAGWDLKSNHRYKVVYYDENDKEIILEEYSVSEGERFLATLANYNNKRPGYTALEFYDDEGNVWDNNFTHPGGDEDLTIKVVVDYLKGDFRLVKTASDLTMGIARKQNIYLLNDLDLKGASINFGDFSGQFLGNGYTVSNFSISYDASRSGLVEDFHDETKQSLQISLFGKMNDALVKDVSFINVLVDVNTFFSSTDKIYVAPIAISVENSVIENVIFSGNFKHSRLPTEDYYQEGHLVYVTDQAYYLKDNESEITNSNINIILGEKEN